ncbi:hypothetical protein NGF19_26655 [Streptomyces sp. RY43-2]|uniref:DUF2231 domain-containing protein n=1 Tax=Streptomyces macrolidinus TaxID=2952607 RepID=A0ABT0ZL54_9ACTN|nr:DUF2231 domain-containing protein [Streptomyces macrolidinus]MCN9244323.1 hypothetical protein [Streptomyces macrolidinus]
MSLVNGLPAHVLFVHAVVVLVPLSALALVVGAVWPKAARRLGLILPVLAFASLVAVPLTTQAGEWLEQHVDSDALVRRHAELGDGLLPWVAGLFVLAAAVWWTTGRASAPQAGPSAAAGARGGMVVRVAAVVLSVVVAAGAVVDVYRIGDSGAKAAWHDGFSQRATEHRDTDGE